MQKKCRQKITSTTRSLCGNSKLNGSHLPPHLCNVMTMGTLSHCAHHCMHACTHARTYPPSLTAHTHTHTFYVTLKVSAALSYFYHCPTQKFPCPPTAPRKKASILICVRIRQGRGCESHWKTGYCVKTSKVKIPGMNFTLFPSIVSFERTLPLVYHILLSTRFFQTNKHFPPSHTNTWRHTHTNK